MNILKTTFSVFITKCTFIVRNKDNGKDGFNNWQFMSVHHWEEPAVGEWKFTFRNDHPTATGALLSVQVLR